MIAKIFALSWQPAVQSATRTGGRLTAPYRRTYFPVAVWENAVELGESRLDNLIVLRPAGRLDNVTAPQFQTRLLQLLASGTADLVIDLTTVDYMSSGGLRALGVAAKQTPAGRRIAVCGLHALVLDVFSIAHFEQLIPVFASADDARQAWAEPKRSGQRSDTDK